MSSWQNFVKAKALKTDTVGKERGEPMNYFDKNGNQIKAGMEIRMADGSFERVYETTDAYGNPDLGINATNEEYLERHPYASREYYSLCNFDMSEVEIVDQMELPGMSIGNNVDMNRANSIRPLMTKLKDTAQRTGCAIVLIGHLNKNNSGIMVM